MIVLLNNQFSMNQISLNRCQLKNIKISCFALQSIFVAETKPTARYSYTHRITLHHQQKKSVYLIDRYRYDSKTTIRAKRIHTIAKLKINPPPKLGQAHFSMKSEVVCSKNENR